MHLTVHEEKRYKMYIVKKKNTYIHWWGKIIVLISNDEYYKLNDLETYLVQKIMRNNNSINVINSISNELEVDTCEAEEFVSIFLNNYDSIFEYKKQNKAMNISGEKGKYFPFELHISLTNMCNQNVFTNSSLPSTCQLEDYSDAGILLRP